MYKQSLAFLLALAALLPAARAQHPTPPQRPTPSPEVRAIEAALRIDKFDLDLSHLPKMSKEAAAAFSPDGMETYDVPYPPGVADAFSYTIIYDKTARRYWVRRMGGFAGVNELFGPATMAARPPSPPK